MHRPQLAASACCCFQVQSSLGRSAELFSGQTWDGVNSHSSTPVLRAVNPEAVKDGSLGKDSSYQL